MSAGVARYTNPLTLRTVEVPAVALERNDEEGATLVRFDEAFGAFRAGEARWLVDGGSMVFIPSGEVGPPCSVCGKPSTMEAGATPGPLVAYCDDHGPEWMGFDEEAGA